MRTGFLTARIGKRTFAYVEVDGPMRLPELRRLREQINMHIAWWEEDEMQLALSLADWGEAIQRMTLDVDALSGLSRARLERGFVR
jgi:hypothetical protein